MSENEEGLRAFLDRRERQIMNRLGAAQSAVEQLQIDLDEVRRARTAIDDTDAAKGLKVVYSSLRIGESTKTIADVPDELTSEPPSIKEYILMALNHSGSRLVEGATANEIREFIKDAYGRDIERSSFSPQLSRLREEGLINLLPSGQWVLASQEGDTPGRRSLSQAPRWLANRAGGLSMRRLSEKLKNTGPDGGDSS